MPNLNTIISLTEEIRRQHLQLHKEINEPASPNDIDWVLVRHHAAQIIDAVEDLYIEVDDDL